MINIASNNDRLPVTNCFITLNYTCLQFSSTQTSGVCLDRRSGSFHRAECWVKVQVKRNSGRYISSEISTYSENNETIHKRVSLT